jgi:hypothetical protein
MPERIASDAVLPQDSVGEVRVEKPIETWARVLPDLLKTLTAVLVTVVGFIVCLFVLLSSNPDLKDLKTGAWTLFAAIVGGVVTYLYGLHRSAS